MREIKFRAWNKKAEVYETGWCYPTKINEITDKNGYMEFGFYQNDDIVLMQYTGLKDKNDKEIYEGDIIKLENVEDEKYKYGSVIWNNDGGTFLFADCFPEYVIKQGCKVIGNVYENPELLK